MLVRPTCPCLLSLTLLCFPIVDGQMSATTVRLWERLLHAAGAPQGPQGKGN